MTGEVFLKLLGFVSESLYKLFQALCVSVGIDTNTSESLDAQVNRKLSKSLLDQQWTRSPPEATLSKYLSNLTFSN